MGKGAEILDLCGQQDCGYILKIQEQDLLTALMWKEENKDDSKGFTLNNLRNEPTTHQNGPGWRNSRFVKKNKNSALILLKLRYLLCI